MNDTTYHVDVLTGPNTWVNVASFNDNNDGDDAQDLRNLLAQHRPNGGTRVRSITHYDADTVTFRTPDGHVEVDHTKVRAANRSLHEFRRATVRRHVAGGAPWVATVEVPDRESDVQGHNAAHRMWNAALAAALDSIGWTN